MSSSSLLRTSSSWSAMSASCSLSIIPLMFATVRIQSASDSEIRDEKEFEAAAQSFVPVLNISAQAERTAPQPRPRPQLPTTWVRPLPPLPDTSSPTRAGSRPRQNPGGRGEGARRSGAANGRHTARNPAAQAAGRGTEAGAPEYEQESRAYRRVDAGDAPRAGRPDGWAGAADSVDGWNVGAGGAPAVHRSPAFLIRCIIYFNTLTLAKDVLDPIRLLRWTNLVARLMTCNF